MGMPNLTTAQILDRISLHSLATHAWHAEHGPALAALSLKLMRSEQMGASPDSARLYAEQRLALLPSLDALKSKALTFGPVEIAEAELTIARGAFVDADDVALQAAQARLEAARVEAALDRIERHWAPRKTDAAHPFVNLGAAMAAE
jgi:hypothetical protein